MEKISKVILLCMIITLAVFGLARNCLAASADSTKDVSATGNKPINPGVILDDFRYEAPVNIWGGLTGTFSKSTTIPTPSTEICTASYIADSSTTSIGGSGYALQLDYNVDQSVSPIDGKPTYAGYYSKLSDLSGSTNLASLGYTALSFYVKGKTGGEFFKIQLKNSSVDNFYFSIGNGTHYSRNIASVYINDYLDKGVKKDVWQKVTIPFHNFANLDAWDSMLELAIVFENSQNTANGSSTNGTIYIGNITFETAPVGAVRVDYFGDKLGVCTMGGNIGTATGSGGTVSYAFSSTPGEYVNPDGLQLPYGFRMNYDVTSTNAWASSYLIFGGGNTNSASEHPEKGGWIAVYHDFSAYSKLSFSIRASSDTENPKTMKIELVDSVGAKFYVIPSENTPAPITSAWQTYNISLSDFTGLDKANIKQLNFVFEQWRISAAGGNKSGAVLIDSIRFE